MITKTISGVLIVLLLAVGLVLVGAVVAQRSYPVTKTEAQWKKQLTPEQFRVLRNQGTEAAYSGKLWNNHEAGTYACAGCAQKLFSSKTKFESGTGWPSFWQPVTKKSIVEIEDRSHGMVRTEVVCSRCGGHLGHVFDDGPKPTGLRYCINSVSLTFAKEGSKRGSQGDNR